MANRFTFTRVANSPGLLLAAFVMLMTVASVLYGIFEDAGLFNSLYWSVVTATTLGYGDFAPQTTAGKVLTSALIASTVFLFIPTITANLASKLIVNRDAFTHEEQEEVKDTLKAILTRLDAADDNPAQAPLKPPKRAWYHRRHLNEEWGLRCSSDSRTPAKPRTLRRNAPRPSATWEPSRPRPTAPSKHLISPNSKPS